MRHEIKISFISYALSGGSLTALMQVRQLQSTISSPSPPTPYAIGTAWELLDKTFSGTELDWAFDTAGAFALIVQIGTAPSNSSSSNYWPPLHVAVPGLLDKVL
jgi:hypothetical protein